MKKSLIVICAVLLLSGCDNHFKTPAEQIKEASWGIAFCGDNEKVKEIRINKEVVYQSWVKCKDERISSIPMQGVTA